MITGTFDITSERGYDVVCALRGPDSENADLKYLTTSVVRLLAGMAPMEGSLPYHRDSTVRLHYRGSALVVTPYMAGRLWAVLTAEQKENVRAAWHSDWHFRNHIFRGLDALVGFGSDDAAAHKRWLLETLGDY